MGTTNVGQNEILFGVVQFYRDRNRQLNFEEKQQRDEAIKIRKYLIENGELEIPVYPDIVKDKDMGTRE